MNLAFQWIVQRMPLRSVLARGRKTGIYFAGAILARLVLFALLPLYSHILPPQVFGEFDLTISLLYLAMTFSFFDLHHTLLRFFYERQDASATGSPASQLQVLKNAVPLLLAGAILMVGILAIFHWISPIRYIGLVVLYGLCNKLVDIYAGMTRGMNKPGIFSVSFTLHGVITGVSNILLLLVFSLGISALYISEILGFLVQLIYLEYHTRLSRALRINTRNLAETRKILQYTIPFGLTVGAYWFLNRYSRIVVSREMDLASTGIFAMTMALTTGVLLFSRSILYSWQETAYGKQGTDDHKIRFFSHKLGSFFLGFSFLYVVILPLMMLAVPLVLGPAYRGAIEYLPLALLSVICFSLEHFLSHLFGHYKASKEIVASSSVGVLVTLGTINQLVVSLGINGASIGMILGILTSVILKIGYLVYAKGLPLPLAKTGISAGVILVSLYISTHWSALPMIALSIFLAAVLLLWFFLDVNHREVRE